ncbi:zinc-binding dehydrogenase [Mycobacterium parmense]|uniref:zinc-binding dehydrogenase n=1 Tax=Mycobacterium parmense TaxID=185642 RepID=UPI001E5BE226|nr:zinc-binding dehydrogenase [Mycobacterium parmense]
MRAEPVRTARRGHPAYCESFVIRNLTGVGVEGSGTVRDAAGTPIASRWFGQSSFASHVIAAARNVVKVDPTIPLELLGPLGCGVLTGAGSILVALGVDRGDSVVVFGAGSVGLSAVMAAHVAGAATVVAVDRNRARLQPAAELGATHTFDANAPDLESQLIKVTGGGPRYALDTTGVPSVIETAIRVLLPSGTCGLVGAKQGDVVLDPNTLAFGRTDDRDPGGRCDTRSADFPADPAVASGSIPFRQIDHDLPAAKHQRGRTCQHRRRGRQTGSRSVNRGVFPPHSKGRQRCNIGTPRST